MLQYLRCTHPTSSHHDILLALLPPYLELSQYMESCTIILGGVRPYYKRKSILLMCIIVLNRLCIDAILCFWPMVVQ